MELATEVYLASLLTIEVDHFMERGYLDELARALKLDDNLKGHRAPGGPVGGAGLSPHCHQDCPQGPVMGPCRCRGLLIAVTSR